MSTKQPDAGTMAYMVCVCVCVCVKGEHVCFVYVCLCVCEDECVWRGVLFDAKLSLKAC